MLRWGGCVKEAAKNHPDLISAKEVIKQERANKAITASGLFPQVDFDGSAKTAKTTTTNSTTGVTRSTTTDTYSYGISGTQLAFDGFKTVNDLRSDAENIKAAQYNYNFASSEVRLNLRTAFVALLKAQELITLRYHSGLEHRGALLTAEANLSEANFELAQAERDIELDSKQLTKELGRIEFKPVKVEADFTIRDTAIEKPDFEAIAKNNPSLLELTAKKNAALFNVKSAYADFFPHSFQIRNMADIKNALESTTKTMSLLLGAIAAISLLVGGIGIMNIMLVSVTERTREIGLRKAIGANNKDIMIQFIIEAVSMSFIGGIAGILLGVGVSALITFFAGWAVRVSYFSIMLATLFSLIIGIVFGLWPAQKASQLDPIEALRYE
jgi:ABC-type antimicrobial peptide transport system permease subunit